MATRLGTLTGKVLVQFDCTDAPVEIGTIEIPVEVTATAVTTGPEGAASS